MAKSKKKKSDSYLDEVGVRRALTRIAHEIIERNKGVKDIALVGVLTRGAILAKRLREIIKELEGVQVDLGLMDINLYRDDAGSRLDQPQIQRTDILFDVVNKHIVLVDDVLFTGRTVRAALDQLIDFGRPKSIQLAVLVDRGHRELPIRADYVGKNLPTNRSDQVSVLVKEKDGEDAIYVQRESHSKVKETKSTASSSSKPTKTKKSSGSKK